MQLAQLAELEVKHRCHQVLELGFPLGGIAKLFAQDWEGDVTVVMPATLAQVCPLRAFSFFANKKQVLFRCLKVAFHLLICEVLMKLSYHVKFIRKLFSSFSK